jgi:drug/metabolite transporter (DMT)-like permease
LNKRGQLSPRQREWLTMVARGVRTFSWRNAFITIGFTFLGLCILLALSFQNERSHAALLSSPVNLMVLIGMVPLILGILALAIFLNYRNANRLENSVISPASGTVRFDQDSSGESGITSYYVFVGKKRFNFGDEMSGVFNEGEKYKVYYCKSGVYEFVMSYEQQ